MLGRIAVTACAFAMGLGHSAAMAQAVPAETIDQQELLPALGMTNVMPALAVATANQLATIGVDGAGYISATAANGLVFEVHFRACDEAGEPALPQGCKAMYLTATWSAVDPAQRAQMNELMASFLAEHPLVNAATLEDSSPYLLRYVIADYGIPQGNLVSEFANFVGVATDFHNQVSALLTM